MIALAALFWVGPEALRAQPGDRVVRLSDRMERAEVDVRPIAAARRIELELPGGHVLSARRRNVELRGGDDVLWSGRSASGERVVLTVEGGRLAGTIFGGETSYQIFPRGAGGHVLVEIGASGLAECAGTRSAESTGSEASSSIEPAPARPNGDSVNRSPRIDLLVLYAAEATAAVGSTRNIRTVIRHYVDLTNVALHNSEVAARVRLVHSAEVILPGGVRDDNARILDWIASSAAVADLRAAHGADLVGLVYEHSARACGSAAMIYRPGSAGARRAFFESRRLCGANTFAHEIGHLMGADHNPENAVVASGEFIYGRGHYYDGRYRTLMSYTDPCGGPCPPQPFFSNPGVRYDGRATGRHGERDNARILDDFAADVESFVDEVDDSTVCTLSPGDADYCLECGPCVSGEGDCEADSECAAGLTCDAGGGPDFGLGVGVGVCRSRGGCSLEPGDPRYCLECGPCGYGSGDCDSGRECQPGLTCLEDVGETFGLPPSVDVCGFRENGFCPLEPGHPEYCAACGPCQAGEGNCNGNLECTTFLTCFQDVGGQLGFKAGTNVCLPAAPDECGLQPGNARFCKLCGTCDVGEGDCDTDRECGAGLTCADGAGVDFGFGEGIDVCVQGSGAGTLAAPKRLKAKVLSPSRVRLKWKDKSKSEDGFHLEMSREGGPFGRIETTNANRRKVVVSGLESGVTYTFRVQAFDATGVSSYSNERTITTP